MTAPLYGTTKQAHAEQLLADAEGRLLSASAAVREGRRLRPLERAEMSRRLAGAIGALEAVRIWLGAGAPR